MCGSTSGVHRSTTCARLSIRLGAVFGPALPAARGRGTLARVQPCPTSLVYVTPVGSLHYAWIVAATTFVVLIVVAGIRATPGVLMLPIEHDMGWSAQTISACRRDQHRALRHVGPFAAALMQTFGLRRTMVLGSRSQPAASSRGLLARTVATDRLTWGVIAGTGLGMLAMVLAASVANRWFVAQRGSSPGRSRPQPRPGS
jgi:hypothetical protein